MTLRPIDSRRVLATLTADDLNSYRINYRSMNTEDSATRTMLDDLLSMMSHMGLRHFGDRVTIECTARPDGSCDMLFTVSPPVRWLFETSEDLFFAARAGVLPKQPCAVQPCGAKWLLTPKSRLSTCESALLSEFGTPLTDIG